MSKIAIIYLGEHWIICPSLQYEEIIPSVSPLAIQSLNYVKHGEIEGDHIHHIDIFHLE
jgi:hypothetical protein